MDETDHGRWPRVSVVTPSLNQGRFIEETIRSVLLQGYPELEYIVMDGGSTDGSVEIIRKYEPWLASWVSEADAGQTAAINLGWSRSTGDVLSYINSDDSYLPNALRIAMEAHRSAGRSAMTYGAAVVVDDAGRELRTWHARPFTLRAMLTVGNVVPQSASFYSREALEQVGYLDERWRMIMDYDLSLRIGLHFPSACLPARIATFRDHGESRSRTLFPLMAREVVRLVDELEGLGAALPDDWSDLKRHALSRVHYEWAMSCVSRESGGGADAARHLRISLRLYPRFALRRPVQTAYVVKEILRRSLTRPVPARDACPSEPELPDLEAGIR